MSIDGACTMPRRRVGLVVSVSALFLANGGAAAAGIVRGGGSNSAFVTHQRVGGSGTILAPLGNGKSPSLVPTTAVKTSLEVFPGQQTEVTNDMNPPQDIVSDNWELNKPYAALLALFLAYAFVLSPGELFASVDKELMERTIAEPQSMNQIFFAIFNFLGVMPLIMASLVLPSARQQKLNPLWFTGASMAAGYFAMGIYLCTHKPCSLVLETPDLNWLARHVTENKIFNVLVLGLALTIGSGLILPLATEGDAVLAGFQQLAQESKFVSVSTADLAALSVAAALLIPLDLQQRGFADKSRAQQIALLTLLFPVVGPAAYCVWRPAIE